MRWSKRMRSPRVGVSMVPGAHSRRISPMPWGWCCESGGPTPWPVAATAPMTFSKEVFPQPLFPNCGRTKGSAARNGGKCEASSSHGAPGGAQATRWAANARSRRIRLGVWTARHHAAPGHPLRWAHRWIRGSVEPLGRQGAPADAGGDRIAPMPSRYVLCTFRIRMMGPSFEDESTRRTTPSCFSSASSTLTSADPLAMAGGG